MYMYIYICTYLCKYLCIYICMCVYICMHTSTHTWMHTHLYTHTYKDLLYLRTYVFIISYDIISVNPDPVNLDGVPLRTPQAVGLQTPSSFQPLSRNAQPRATQRRSLALAGFRLTGGTWRTTHSRVVGLSKIGPYFLGALKRSPRNHVLQQELMWKPWMWTLIRKAILSSILLTRCIACPNSHLSTPTFQERSGSNYLQHYHASLTKNRAHLCSRSALGSLHIAMRSHAPQNEHNDGLGTRKIILQLYLPHCKGPDDGRDAASKGDCGRCQQGFNFSSSSSKSAGFPRCWCLLLYRTPDHVSSPVQNPQYLHAYMHTCIHTYISTYLHTYIPIHIDIHVHTCRYMYICICIYTYTLFYIHTLTPRSRAMRGSTKLGCKA